MQIEKMEQKAKELQTENKILEVIDFDLYTLILLSHYYCETVNPLKCSGVR